MRVWSPMPIDGRQAGRQVCQIRPVKGNRSEGGDGRRMKAEWINRAQRSRRWRRVPSGQQWRGAASRLEVMVVTAGEAERNVRKRPPLSCIVPPLSLVGPSLNNWILHSRNVCVDGPGLPHIISP
ncbi:hypothetical protein IG631_11270 [Alternaria alternata]|nr:hypothetical protein IG631_11270 [Alternaria alternata]